MPTPLRQIKLQEHSTHLLLPGKLALKLSSPVLQASRLLLLACEVGLELRKLLLQGCSPHAGVPLLLGGSGSLVGELLLQAGHLSLELPFQLHKKRQGF